MCPLFPLWVIAKLMRIVCKVRPEVGGESISRKSVPAALCPLRNTAELPWDRVRAFDAKSENPGL